MAELAPRSGSWRLPASSFRPWDKPAPPLDSVEAVPEGGSGGLCLFQEKLDRAEV